MPTESNRQRAESDLLSHPLQSEDEFRRKMAHILAVPKSELEKGLQATEQANADKPKRGRKKKTA